MGNIQVKHYKRGISDTTSIEQLGYNYFVSIRHLKKLSLNNAKNPNYNPDLETIAFYESIIPMALKSKRKNTSNGPRTYYEYSEAYEYSESSFKTAFSFFVGMIFTRATLLKKYKVKLYHYGDLVSDNTITPNPQKPRFSPDFFGVNIQDENDVYIVEAKGTSSDKSKSNSQLKDGFDQVTAVQALVLERDGVQVPFYDIKRHVVGTYFKNKELKIGDLEVVSPRRGNNPPLNGPSNGPTNYPGNGGNGTDGSPSEPTEPFHPEETPGSSNSSNIHDELGYKIMAANLDLAEMIYYKPYYQLIRGRIGEQTDIQADADTNLESEKYEIIQDKSTDRRFIVINLRDITGASFSIGLEIELFVHLQNRDYIYQTIDTNKYVFNDDEKKTEYQLENDDLLVGESEIKNLNMELKAQDQENALKEKYQLISNTYDKITSIERKLEETTNEFIHSDGVYYKS